MTQLEHAGVDEFTEFVKVNESRLRHALIAACGGEIGRDAASEALAYGWQHWDRVHEMENPVGYLYAVGRNHGRRAARWRRPVTWVHDTVRIPDVEPALLDALASLSERQRTAVILVYCFEWTLTEVAEVLGLTKCSV